MEPLRLIPGYRVVKVLGSGAWATTYLGEDSKGHRVAMKVVKLDRPGQHKAVEDLSREYRILSRLNHPCIPTAIQLRRLHDGICMVSQYCGGGSLRNMMINDQRKLYQMASQFLEQSSTALHHMHEKGIIHRDFKPENLVISDDGTIHLIDLGLAWRKPMLMAVAPSLAGTPVYLAPELIMGQKPSRASDLYSYAATAYELFSGKPPYEGNCTQDVLQKIRRGNAPMPSNSNGTVSTEINRLTMLGISANPADRPSELLVYGHQLAEAVRKSPVGPPNR
jgi:serine/threonine protein kinase